MTTLPHGPSFIGMRLLRVPEPEPVVVIAGHVTRDGGGPAIAAAQTYRRLGAIARLVTSVGTDFARKELLATVATEVRIDGVSTALGGEHWLARAQPVLAVDLPEAWRRCDLLHLAPVLGEVDLGRWAQVANARLVAISVGGFVRAPGRNGAITMHRPWADRRGLIAVDAACVAESDLDASPSLLAQLIGAVPIVAITRRTGVSVLVRGLETALETALPSSPPPAFDAAFFHGLASGLSPVDAATRASRLSVDKVASDPRQGAGIAGLGRRVG